MEHNNETIRIAVKLYLENEEEGIKQYGHIKDWNTKQVLDMNNMFCDATKFNEDISQWNTSNVTDMSFMFNDAQEFNQDISNWNTNKVFKMNSMFYNARLFNQNISQWNINNLQFKNNIIDNTVLFDRLNGKSCFDKKAMCKLFTYDRRKNFLKFLVESGFVPYQGKHLQDTNHAIFGLEEMNRSIMSFI